MTVCAKLDFAKVSGIVTGDARKSRSSEKNMEEVVYGKLEKKLELQKRIYREQNCEKC